MKKENLTIFIAEDDEWYAEILKHHLSHNPDYQLEAFHSGKELLNNLHKKPDIISLDFSLPDFKGDKLLKRIKSEHPEIEVVIISAQEDITTAVDLLKDGAYDYIVKNDDTKDRLWNSIIRIKEKLELKTEITQLRKEVIHKYNFDKAIKGNSKAIQKVFGLMERASKSNISVSITGETGTGKELVAKAIHYNSPRKDKAFVAVNMAAIPNELIESELFGHEKGAFTGAHSRRKGKFEEAKGGTIFLDEIGELAPSLQAKLLRVLQEKEVTRLGSNQVIKTDVRVIVATHKNLAEEVKNGNFREDLYYRLLGLPLPLPPLRERGNDILIIARHCLKQFCKENGFPDLKFSPEAQEKLLSYPFPGNVRELKAVVELSAVMANSEVIEPNDISLNSEKSIAHLMNSEMTLKDYTEKIIFHYLDKYNGSVPKVAEKLDIGQSTIYRLKSNINKPSQNENAA